MSAKRGPLHPFRDRGHRKLCDICNRWIGAPVHTGVSVEAAITKFRTEMQGLVDKGDVGRITMRVGDGPETVIAEKQT